MVQPIYARVYTDFFKRDAQIYALGDFRFSKPKSLKAVGYTLALLVIWSCPVALLIGVDKVFSNVVFAAIVIGPAIGMGSIMGKPLFHNKPLMKDLRSIFKYGSESSVYTDGIGYPYTNTNEIDLGSIVWIADADCYEEDETDGGNGDSKNGLHLLNRRKVTPLVKH